MSRIMNRSSSNFNCYIQLNLRRFFFLCLLLGIFMCLFFLRIPQARADTEVGGPITSDTTWTLADSPYIIATESVSVTQGITLTIEPGVTVRFNPGLKLWVNGTLVARGNSSYPITFTSNQPNPMPGNWGNIDFSGSMVNTVVDSEGNYISGSILQHCNVEYGGWDGVNFQNAIYTFGTSLMVDHCLIENNLGSGIMIYRANSNYLSWITNNVLQNNKSWGHGGGVLLYWGVIKNNIISNNTARANSDGGGIFASNATIIDNIITYNTTEGTVNTQGAGIFAQANQTGTILIQGNIIQQNSAVNYGGGIYVNADNPDAEFIVKENLISRNYAFTDGGGIYIRGSKGIVYIQDNILSSNIADYDDDNSGNGGGIYCEYIEGLHALQDNIITGNSAGGSGGGIFTNICDISGNYIYNNSAVESGGGIVSTGDIISNTISTNSISGVNAMGAGVLLEGSGDFLYNSVVNNAGPGLYTGGLQITDRPQVHHNNLFGNYPYNVSIETLPAYQVDGTLNYWNTEDEIAIMEGIYDNHDKGSQGEFIYEPFLTEQEFPIPLNVPTGLTATLVEDRIDLEWDLDPNFAQGWGYKVYYDTDALWPPYEGTDLIEGDSPIDVGDLTSFTLNGIEANTDYYLAVTVYDDKGRESDYAIAVVYQEWVPLPSTPTGLTATLIGDHIDLKWDADPYFAQGWGYLVYYDTDSASEPFEGTGLDEGDSPIDVGDQTTYTLNGVIPYTDYYLAVTVYDNLGNESYYAIAIIEQDDAQPIIYLPLISR
jgi:hypothetical protein